MPDSEAMTIDERRKCVKRIQGRYLAAGRADRGRLLDDLEALTGLHRKSLVRLLRSADLGRRPAPRGGGGSTGSRSTTRCG